MSANCGPSMSPWVDQANVSAVCGQEHQGKNYGSYLGNGPTKMFSGSYPAMSQACGMQLSHQVGRNAQALGAPQQACAAPMQAPAPVQRYNAGFNTCPYGTVAAPGAF
jgi:hypothetical protein